jgi:SAM-dependent methyltransferase
MRRDAFFATFIGGAFDQLAGPESCTLGEGDFRALTWINDTTSRGTPLITNPVSPALDSGPVSLAPEGGLVTVLRDRWDAHAQEWIDWVRDPARQDSYWRFHRDRFLSLVPDPGRLTLDIGCGEGRVARDLRAQGHRVLGIDCSFTMCQAAATYPDQPSQVAVGDAAKLPLADATADCAIAFMSLQDIDDMPGAIKEIARVLADRQKLALAIVHPMYSASGRNPDDNFVIKRPYLKSDLCVSIDRRDGLTMTFYREHRPMQAYVDALLEAGFSIERLLELTDEREGKPPCDVPMFLHILAVRRLPEKATDSTGQSGSTQYCAVPTLRPQGREYRVVTENSGQFWRGRATLERVNSSRKALGARTTARLPFSVSGRVVSGLIVVASSLIALLAVSH